MGIYESSGVNEVRDLAAAAVSLLVTFLLAYITEIMYYPVTAAGIIVGVLAGFILHELGHRFAARALGYQAFFKAWKLGIVLSIASGLLAGLFSLMGLPILPVIAAPGAVYVVPRTLTHVLYTRRDELFISSSGPLMNILITVISLAVTLLATGGVRYVGVLVSRVNAWLALFNLLPIPPLDGFKVARSSVLAWIILAVTAFGLLVISMYM